MISFPKTFRLPFAALALSLACPPLGLASDAPRPEASPLSVLASFVGGVWTGSLPPGPDGAPVSIEMRFTWGENQRVVRFESAFVKGDRRSPYTSGLYAWDPANKNLVLVYADAGGGFTQGAAKIEGDVMVHELVVKEPAGTTEPVRVRLTKAGLDAFTNEIFTQKDGAWSKFVEVKYERKK